MLLIQYKFDFFDAGYSQNISILQYWMPHTSDHFESIIDLPSKLNLLDLKNPADHVHIHCKPSIDLSQLRLEDKISSQQVLQYLKAFQPEEEESYDLKFVQTFLLIKLNALLSVQCSINYQFLNKLACFYNELAQKSIKILVSQSDESFFAQILLQNSLYEYLSLKQIENILPGGCLVSTTLALAIFQGEAFLRKAEYSFTLSFTALQGKSEAFTPIVHQEKNHYGQMHFVDKVRKLIPLEIQMKAAVSTKVQDNYSLRCTPQVYGVAYDCLNQAKIILEESANMFHFKNLTINGVQYPNLAITSQGEVLAIDMLLCSLHQTGSTAFLRAERILNSYLTKSNIQQRKQEYHELAAFMERVIHCVANNKLICIPSNGDTMSISNYQKDIFYADGKVYEKQKKLFKNLYDIMALQIFSSLSAIDEYESSQEDPKIFSNEEMQSVYIYLKNHIVTGNRKESISNIKQKWQIQ